MRRRSLRGGTLARVERDIAWYTYCVAVHSATLPRRQYSVDHVNCWRIIHFDIVKTPTVDYAFSINDSVEHSVITVDDVATVPKASVVVGWLVFSYFVGFFGISGRTGPDQHVC